MINHKGTLPLETPRLRLRRLKPDDAVTMFDTWASDPEVTKFMRWNAHENVEESLKWLQQEERKYADTANYSWGIELKDTGRIIGSIGTVNEDGEPECLEVGYCMGKAYWNQGYMTEALKRMIEYLSDEVGIKHFAAKHAVQNPASGAVIRHVGFRCVGKGSYKSFDGTRAFEGKRYCLDIE